MKLSKHFKKRLFNEDKGICYLCKLPMGLNDWNIDHIIPISKGGKTVYYNLKATHIKCNLEKGNK